MAAAMSGVLLTVSPTMYQLSIEHMLLRTGIPPSRFWHSAPDFVEGLLALRALLRVRRDPAQPPRAQRRIGNGGSRASSGARRGRGAHPLEVGGLDLLSLRRPARSPRPPGPPPRRTFRVSILTSLPPRVGVHPRLARAALRPGSGTPLRRRRRGRRAGGPRIPLLVHGEVTSPLDYYLDLFGFEQAAIGFLEDPGRAGVRDPGPLHGRDRNDRRGIGRCRGGRRQDLLALAGAGFLSTAFYRHFVLPFESRIAQAAEARGVRAYIHTCGDIDDRLETHGGVRSLGHRVPRPPPLGRVDLGDAKGPRRIAGLLVKGNLDPVHVLLARRPGLPVRADARRRPAAGRPRRPLHPELGLLDRPPHAGGEHPGPGRGRRRGRRLLS
ncbi:MAG: uroporphyrinogen decarboxylase family protein [Candidatus Moduliflexus flocculans]|nr:uroporphyrinogen decarboxylase family protein [Candidatus Moduliflexus flocculans]